MEMKFILQEVKSGKKDYREIYLKNVLEQYKSATGCKQIDFKSTMFRSDFNSWLNQRKDLSSTYRSLLDYLESESDYSMTAELGKGLVDSIAPDTGTTIITPYTYGFNRRQGNRIIQGTISYVSSNDTHKSLEENDKTLHLDTFMTQNPYHNQELDIFEKMHNSEKYDIIVGIYGTNYDKDKETKLKLLKEFKERLYENYKEEYMRYNDKYFYAIATKHKTKLKKHTL